MNAALKFRDRVRGLVRRPASGLKPAQKNFRTHDERQRRVFRGLVAEIGVAGAVIAWIPDARARAKLAKAKDPATWLAAYRGPLQLIDGHLRAEELTAGDLPVLVTDLDSAEAAKALATFDAVSDLAGTNAELLASLLAELGTPSEAGTEDMLAKLRELLPRSAEEDDVPEAPASPRSEVGALYELGPHRLLCDDSTKAENVARVLDGAEPMLWVCDPPFDLDYSAWLLLPSVQVVAVWHRSKAAIMWMAATFDDKSWGVHALIFTGGTRGHHNPWLPCCLHDNVAVWRRGSAFLDRDAIARTGCNVTVDGRHYSWHEDKGGTKHDAKENPWGKPVFQFELAMVYVPHGACVWDPCAGGGASLIAAAKHGRVWRGCEVEARWADVIRIRWTRWARENNIDPGPGALDPGGGA